MGWNCKYDKQIAKALGLIFLFIFFVGCKNKDNTEEQTEDYSQYIKIDSDVTYMAVTNLTNESVYFKNFGEFKSSSRQIEWDDYDIDEFDLYIPKKVDIQMHSKINKDMQSARSAYVNASVSAGTNQLETDNSFWYIKNPLENSYTFNKQETDLKWSEDTSHCRVYSFGTEELFPDENENPNSIYKTIAEKFDLIFKKETNICGKNYLDSYPAIYITPDENSKIDILIYDINGDGEINSNGQSGIVGYFSPNDFYYNNSYSNKREVFYIDSYWLKDNPEEVFSTLAHEFNHMLNFVNKTCKYGIVYDTWFTEMLAMCAEDLLQDTLDLPDYYSPKNRLDYFNIYSYYGFIDPWESNVSLVQLIGYANTYAFGAYLLRNYGGAELFYELATNSYVDSAAISQALTKSGYSEDFESVVRKFHEVFLNIQNNFPSLASLNIECDSKVNEISYHLSKINLTESYYNPDNVDSNGNQLEWNGPVSYYLKPMSRNSETLDSCGFVVINMAEYQDMYFNNYNSDLIYNFY